MTPIKNYIGEQFINNTYRFKCDCLVPFDLTGVVKDYRISGNEIILLVDVNGKLIHIGLNTSALYINAI